jgi:hypothetical protein
VGEQVDSLAVDFSGDGRVDTIITDERAEQLALHKVRAAPPDRAPVAHAGAWSSPRPSLRPPRGAPPTYAPSTLQVESNQSLLDIVGDTMGGGSGVGGGRMAGIRSPLGALVGAKKAVSPLQAAKARELMGLSQPYSSQAKRR